MGEAHHANDPGRQGQDRRTTKVAGVWGRSPPTQQRRSPRLNSGEAADRRVLVCVNNGRSPSRKRSWPPRPGSKDDKGRGGLGAKPPDSTAAKPPTQQRRSRRPPSPGLREQWAKPITQTILAAKARIEGR